jgi:hypothetical protein
MVGNKMHCRRALKQGIRPHENHTLQFHFLRLIKQFILSQKEFLETFWLLYFKSGTETVLTFTFSHSCDKTKTASHKNQFY